MLGFSARGLVLVFVSIGLLVSAAATLRLAAVTLATPTGQWLVEFPTLVNFPTAPIEPSTAARAERLSQVLVDPALIRARLDTCRRPNEATARGERVHVAERDRQCLKIVDEALRGAPSSGELWLFRAYVLVRSGDFGEAVFTALRNSYRTAPREGWIASSRVVLGLKLYPLVPANLAADIRSDLNLVLLFPDLSRGLVAAYVADAALRRSAAPALESLSPNLLERFLGAVRTAQAA